MSTAHTAASNVINFEPAAAKVAHIATVKKHKEEGNTMPNLMEERLGYKPFGYPWAYEAWLMQQRIHWLPEEVPMADDVKDWQTKVTPAEKNLLTQIFRFFTQSDIEVNNCYMKYYMRVFKPTEVLMMLTSFSNMETVHVAAYSHLLDTIGMPEVEYSAFMEYAEMKDKYDYMQGFNATDKRSIALTMAVFGGFTEGLSLFASFAMLMNFPRFNKMKGMGQIVTWSVRDETLHVQSVTKLFNTFIQENPEVWTADLQADIKEACAKIVGMEDKFIDLAFSMGPVEGLTADEVKGYIRFIADRRLRGFNIEPLYNIGKNPLPWMDLMLNADEHVNFFEQRATEYTKASTKGGWDEAFAGLFDSSTADSARSPVNMQSWEEGKFAGTFKPLQEQFGGKA
jgi:ribonucleoside-diphosphate reductase beta chain